MKVDEVKKWLDEHVGPMAFQRLVMRCLPEFNKCGLFLHNLSGKSLPDSVSEALDKALQEIYNQSIPEYLKQN